MVKKYGETGVQYQGAIQRCCQYCYQHCWRKGLIAFVAGFPFLGGFTGGFVGGFVGGFMSPPAVAQNQGRQCPKALPALVDELLIDLPAYTNRVIQRQSLTRRPKLQPNPANPNPSRLFPSRSSSSSPPQATRFELQSPRTYVLLAGQPQISPLESPQAGSSQPQGSLYQVFFTTLERQYVAGTDGRGKPQEVQQFHQLVMAEVQPPEQWRVIRLRSQLAPYPANNQILSPLRNADQGPTAQAIRLWLRDCAHRGSPGKR